MFLRTRGHRSKRSDAQTGAIVKLLPVYSTHIGPGPMDDVDGLSSERSTPEVRARIVRQRCTQEGPGSAIRLEKRRGPLVPRYEKAHTSHERVMFLRDILKRIFGKILVFGLHIFGQNFTVTVGNGNH